MRVFVDTSAWFAASNVKDRHHQRASELLAADGEFVTSTFVVVETWLLLQSRIGFAIAERFVDLVREGAATLEQSSLEDVQKACQIAGAFQDQTFSLVDRTSFVMMERLGITRVASFDADFVIYRYGPNRDRAFEVLR
jgi:predicted nucleic acid-binding protein